MSGEEVAGGWRCETVRKTKRNKDRGEKENENKTRIDVLKERQRWRTNSQRTEKNQHF